MGVTPPCSTFYSNLDTRTLKVLKGHQVLAGKCPITLQRMQNIHNSLAKSEHYDVITVRIVTYEDEAWKFKPESIRPPRCTSVYEVWEKNRFVSGEELIPFGRNNHKAIIEQYLRQLGRRNRVFSHMNAA
jgi:hypothetical protein